MQDVPTAARVMDCQGSWLRTGHGEKSGGVHRNGPLRNAQDKQLPPSVLQENQLHRQSVTNSTL